MFPQSTTIAARRRTCAASEGVIADERAANGTIVMAPVTGGSIATGGVATDGTDVPIAELAVAVIVYLGAVTSGRIVQRVPVLVVQDCPPGDAVAV